MIGISIYYNSLKVGVLYSNCTGFWKGKSSKNFDWYGYTPLGILFGNGATDLDQVEFGIHDFHIPFHSVKDIHSIECLVETVKGKFIEATNNLENEKAMKIIVPIIYKGVRIMDVKGGRFQIYHYNFWKDLFNFKWEDVNNIREKCKLI